jgi:diguanylate cyclase (GGDEF)-like protein
MHAASSRAEVALVLHAAINDLGGAVVPARLAGPAAVPVDVALGVGEPKVVVVVEPMHPAQLRIAHHLPLLVEDAKAAAAACDFRQRHGRRDSADALTGVVSRRRIGVRLATTGPGAVACMLAVDGLPADHHDHGQSAGDCALHDFETLLRSSVRREDFVARYGIEAFLVLVGRAPLQATRERLHDIVTRWSARKGRALTVSGGLAVVDGRGALAAVRAADTALHRGRRSGPDRLEVATDQDHDESPLLLGEPT